MKRILILPLLACLLLGGLLEPALASTTYADDFSNPGTAWRHGSRIWSKGRGPLTFDHAHRDVTLSSCAVHPLNMGAFSADVRFQFGEVDAPMFVMGWGKPFEWDRIEKCRGRLCVEGAGKFRVDVDGKTIGTGKLAPDPRGDFTVHLEVAQDGVTVGDQKFASPTGESLSSGFWMFHMEGPAPHQYKPMGRILDFKLRAEGDHPPMTETEWRANCDEWTRAHILDNGKVLDTLAAAVAKEKESGKWGYATGLNVNPQLVRKGEPVTLIFRLKGTIPAPSEAWVVPDFLGAHPGEKRPLALKWELSGSDATEQVAVVKLVPDRPGNWQVVWKAGEETLNRMLGVVDNGYAVYRFQFTTQPTLWEPEKPPRDIASNTYPSPPAFELIHQLGLASDFWCGEWDYGRYFVFSPDKTILHSRVLARIQHLWGDSASPLFNADWILPMSPDTNLFRVPPDVQRVGLDQVKRCWEILGLGPLNLLATYTQGPETPVIARNSGVRVLDTMCQWQNSRDGIDENNSWLINHVGAPPFPYYVADDDFRKVAPGKSIVQLPQGTTSAVRMFTIMTMEGCPKNAFICSDSPYEKKMIARGAQSKNIDRFETMVDAWTNEAAHQKEPLFLSISLENFAQRADWNLANCLAVEYLRNKARTHKVVFTQGEGVADYFYNHYDHQPENWIYWPDIYAGLSEDLKPDQLADHMELSNAEFHSDHWDGKALPRFYWNYTQPWSNPPWDNADGLRKYPVGLIDPDHITAANFVPKMEDLSGVKADVDMTSAGADEVRIRVRMDSPKAFPFLPVAAWRIPLSGSGLQVQASQNGRFVPIVDGSTDNLNGVAVCRDVKPGHNEWTFSLKGKARPFVDPAIQIGSSVLGRAFVRDGVPHAYLWTAKGVAESRLSISVPDGRKVRVHYNDGTTEEATNGKIAVRIGGDWPVKSPMISGLSAQELRERAQVTDSSAAAENGTPAPWPMPSSFPVVPPGVNQATLPLPRLEWFQRVKMTIEKAAREAGGIRLIFDGDSITDNWQGEGKQIWAERFEKLDAFDFGISGDRTEHLLWRLSQGQVNNMHPQLIAIMIGTNNMFTNSEAQIAEGVKAVVDDYRRRCPDATILLQAIFPRGHEATDPVRSKLRTINNILAGFADGNKIIYRDFGDKFLQPDGTLSADVMPDFLHPNAKGYQIWADAIQPVIDQFFPPRK